MIRYSPAALLRQRELKKLGFYRGKLDGKFGRKSKLAEKNYLKSIGKIPKKEKKFSLGSHRREFSGHLAKLITHSISLGFEISLQDVTSARSDGRHMRGSQHEKGLAADLNLFKNKNYLTSTKSHRKLGIYWESLSPYNRWGGRYSDGNHYERMEFLWREA